ncbi:hypothetical protein jhhlp_000049 [Lomentospora prolificans]|uniref:RRM domain-containing protein n=1 Tax=Lomentospora prolificans TaxID=41688 RepID=A0A2N3NLJ4_9PEZI|nr:hypothetical protein jhhlp_000049 [Lomentospora prolificans]
MAPKKKDAQKMSLGDFLNDSSFGGSWADEVEDTIGTQPLPAPEHPRGGMGMGGYGGYGGDRGDRGDRGYARESGPQQLPTRPPYTAHLGNLPYDATMEAVNDFFADCGVVSVRIIEDRELQRPKGFAYVEFQELDGLKKALELDGQSFNGRYIKVKIADPPRDRGGGDSGRDLSDWTRKGPLADLPRGNDRREFGERRQVDFSERRAPREPADDGKVRDFGNWERKGPLSPLPQPEAPPMSREGSRARNNADPLRNRHQSPSWGEGRPEGSRPPQREFREKPERVPSAAERDMQWRSNMRPNPQNASPSQSREGSETPASPSQAPAAPATRPKLNLAKRTVSEAPDAASPATTGDSKSNPFGGARPIDTMAREREIEEKRQQAIKERREAEEKAKEERRLAKEAAAKEAAAKAEAEASAAASLAEEEAKPESVTIESVGASKESADATTSDEKAGNGTSKEQKLPARPREPREPREPKEPKEGRPEIKSRATESGNWRQPSGEHRAPRGAPSGPRRGGGGRGGRNDGARGSRANGNSAQQPPATPVTAEPATPTQDEDGWTTVTIPRGSRRGQGRVA